MTILKELLLELTAHNLEKTSEQNIRGLTSPI